MKNASKVIFIGLLAGIFLSITSCVEEEPKIVPDVYVYISINLDLPQYNSLNSTNNAIKIANEGYNKNGVIVYRYSLDEFFAFDATCPQHIEISKSVNLDDNGTAGTATCPHCQTVYFFASLGYPSSGFPLKRYSTSLSGRILTVSN